MEYDFSKIETEDLRVACEYFEAHGTMSCMGLDCYICPLKERACGCVRKPYVAINKEEKYKLFKEELIRREKMENKMPELKNGMVIEIEWSNTDNCKYLIVGDMGYSLKDDGHTADLLEGIGKTIINIYRIKSHYTFSKIKEHLELIWSKKSDKDIKIEELEKTINEAQRQIQELKG